MFDVTVTDEFARWFEALSEPEAESVAALLDLVATAGPALDPERARRLLLYYDGMSEAGRPGPAFMDRALFNLEKLEGLLAWQVAALRSLESRAFRDRLAALDAEAASTLVRAVEALKKRLFSARAAGLWLVREPSLAAKPSPSAMLKEAFADVMQKLGLQSEVLPELAGGLREITMTELSPHARIIYGLDPGARRVVVLVADRLDHSYYGDSVRFAERAFANYLSLRQEKAGFSPFSAR